MASSLDLQEQEQVDALKAFWNRYGSLLTWFLVLVLGAYAAWNGWNWYQRDQGLKAGALFEELDKTVQAADADRGARVFNDLRERYPGTVWAAQGALLLAKLQFERGRVDDAAASLAWVIEKANGDEWRALARLRLSGLHLQGGRLDEALKLLEPAGVKGFEGLAADRRGDILKAQGKLAEAVEAYQVAWKALPETVEYRRAVEAKLTALGRAPGVADGPSK